MRINHNIPAVFTNNQLAKNNSATSGSLEKLSSGQRINIAADDAAGLAISEKMRAQISGLDQARNNANDGISMVRIAEGALSETHSVLQRMRELAVQAASDSSTDDDRAEIQQEIDQLSEEITRIATDTEFNTKKLLDGSMASKATTDVSGVTASIQDAGIASGVYAAVIDYTAGSGASTFTANGTYLHWTDNVWTYTGGSWVNSSGATISDTTDYGITISGTPQEGDTITLTAREVTYTSLDMSGFGSGGLIYSEALIPEGTWTLTYDGTNWRNESNNIVDLTDYGLDTSGSIDSGATVTFEDVVEQAPSSIVVSSSGSGGSSYTVTSLTDSSGNSVSTGAFSFAFDSSVATSSALAVEVSVDNNAVTLQIGASSGQNLGLSINNMSAHALGVDDLGVTTRGNADSALDTIDGAIQLVSAERSKLGAAQNALEHTITDLSASSTNLAAAESQIRDVDMAAEMTRYTRNNILMQSAQAMLAQANGQPQNVLQLLQ